MESVKDLPRFDAAQYLDSDEAIAVFVAAAMETADPSFIAQAFGIVARAKGMTKIADDTGLSRGQLYRSFSENGNPTLKTVLSVMKSLGLELSAQPKWRGVLSCVTGASPGPKRPRNGPPARAQRRDRAR